MSERIYIAGTNIRVDHIKARAKAKVRSKLPFARRGRGGKLVAKGGKFL